MTVTSDNLEIKGSGESREAEILKDTLSIAGLLGSKEAGAFVEELRSTRDSLIDLERQLFSEKDSLLSADIAEIRQRRERDEAELKEIEKHEEKIKPELDRHRADLSSLNRKQNSLLGMLVSRRCTYATKLMSAKIEQLLSLGGKLADVLVGEERKRLDYEKSVNDIAIERRRYCQEEYDRRKADIGRSLDKVRARYELIADRLDSFRLVGLTRTTSGFMLWAGYLGFSALGWYVGTILQSIDESGKGVLAETLGLVVNASGQVIASYGTLRGVIGLVSAPLILGAVAALTLYLADRVMGNLDPRWRYGKRQTGKTKRLNLTWQTSPENVSQIDYQNWMARIPGLVLLLEIPVLLGILFYFGSSSVASGSPGSSLDSPWRAASFTLLGVVLMICLAGIALLYTLHVIQPRNQRILEVSSPKRSLLLWSNWEIVTVMGTAAICLVGAEGGRLLGSDLPLWLGTNAVAVFGIAIGNSFVVSFGLIYHGMFKDAQALGREISEYENQIQKYTAFPVLDISEDEVSRFRHELSELQQRIDDSWDDAVFWETPGDAIGLVPGAGRVFGGTFRRWRSKATKPRPSEVIVADQLFEPELLQELADVQMEIANATERLKHLESGMAEGRDRRRVIENRDWREKLLKLSEERSTDRRRLIEKIEAIKNNYEKRILEGDSALLVGQFLRNDLRAKG